MILEGAFVLFTYKAFLIFMLYSVCFVSFWCIAVVLFILFLISKKKINRQIRDEVRYYISYRKWNVYILYLGWYCASVMGMLNSSELCGHSLRLYVTMMCSLIRMFNHCIARFCWAEIVQYSDELKQNEIHNRELPVMESSIWNNSK